MINMRMATSAALMLLGASCGEDLGYCYASTQNELNERLLQPECRVINVLDFDSDQLSATSERDDVGLNINPDYCVAFDECQADGPILKTANIDNIPTSISDIDSVVMTRYRGGTVLVPQIDLTLGEAPSQGPQVSFKVMNGGSIRIRATAPMDGWSRFYAGALPSWEGVAVEVDPIAQPTTILEFSGAGLNLAQLQQFGAKAREVTATLSAEVAETYASWLESEGFSGTLTVAIDGEVVALLPRATAP